MTISATYSSLQTSLTARARVSDVAAQLETAADELATGLKADVYADLGMRAGQALQLRNQKTEVDRFVTSNEMLSSKLKTTETALGDAHAAVQEFFAISVQSGGGSGLVTGELQQQARVALDRLMSALNTSFSGEYLFAGVDTDKKPLVEWNRTNAGTGQSPAQVMAAITNGEVLSAGDAAAKVAAVETEFDGNFQATMFDGTPLVDAAANPSPRVTARIDAEETLTYGVQANDPAIRSALKGLMMFASVDASKIADTEGYRAWVGKANDALAAGVAGLDDMRIEIGNDRRILSERIEVQKDRSTIYNEGILALEGIDAYEAASIVQNKKALLEATYAATAQIARLSFVNFL